MRIAAAIMKIYLLLILLIIGKSSTAEARELRPSDHGLEYQTLPPTELKSPGMMSFFGTSSTSSEKTPSTVALPKATDSDDDTSSWWRSKNGQEQGSDRLKHILLLGSLVCGVTGVALLVASGFIYIFKTRSSSSIPNSSNINNNNNSK